VADSAEYQPAQRVNITSVCTGEREGAQL